MLQTQLYFGPKALQGVNTLGPNDLGFIPKAVGHFFKDPDEAHPLKCIYQAMCTCGPGQVTNQQLTKWSSGQAAGPSGSLIWLL